MVNLIGIEKAEITVNPYWLDENTWKDICEKVEEDLRIARTNLKPAA